MNAQVVGFAPVAGSSKVACIVCGRSGFPGGGWQATCLRGHAPCPRCGRQLAVLKDGSARVHPARHCPKAGS